jgi:3-phosphoshikimate 1-carboxyvinyltransferase
VKVLIEPAGRIKGKLTAPADKSISHRAAILAAMADEPVLITNYLEAADTLSTLAAIEQLGALVERRSEGLMIRGVGLRNAQTPAQPIDVGNAGTLIRLLPGWLAGQDGSSFQLDGDESIRRRPIDRIAVPLTLMGAKIEATDTRFAPFTVEGARLHGIDYELPVASAQVKSAIELAALIAEGPTTITEIDASRDHTERLLFSAGVKISRVGSELTICPTDELTLPDRIDIPSDPSSAAFAIAAAVLVPGSRLLVEDCSVNWTRSGFIKIAKRMGAVIITDLEERPKDGAITQAEPLSDIDVTAGPLKPTTVSAREVPLAVDELPLIALMACFAEGQTRIEGAAELRLKESDRIAAVVTALSDLGAEVEASEDGLVINGRGSLRGGRVDAGGDHRIAMLGVIAGLASQEGVEVVGVEAAAVSYPNFLDDIAALR